MSEEATKTDPPPSKGKLVIERLNAYRNLILALAALATAVGSWFRPTDTTATKNSFEWTAKKIEELSANDLKTKEDIVGLRNYLEGYVQAQRNSPFALPGTVTVPASLGAEVWLGTEFNLGSEESPETPIAENFVELLPTPEPKPLPDLQSNPVEIKKPAFEQIAN